MSVYVNRDNLQEVLDLVAAKTKFWSMTLELTIDGRYANDYRLSDLPDDFKEFVPAELWRI